MAASSESLSKSLNILPLEKNLLEDSEMQKAYISRLVSYIEDQKWVRRPLMVAPSVCARYGWRCISNQLLVCDTCMASLSAAQPNVQSYESYKAYMVYLRDNLKSSHKLNCPWPLTPCPASYVRMVPMHKEEALKKFKRRFESLMTLDFNLPVIKAGSAAELGLSEETCSALSRFSHMSNSGSNTSAVLLAATGWKREFESKQKRCLSCYCCQRMIALAAQKTAAETPEESASRCSTPESSTPPPEIVSVKRQKLDKTQNENSAEESVVRELPDEMDIDDPQSSGEKAKVSKEHTGEFDPLAEHRPWCLWVIESGVRESNSSVDEVRSLSSIWMPGWKLFIKCLLRNTGSVGDVAVSPLKEQLDNAQNMLESWNRT